MTKNKNNYPKWFREIFRFIGIIPQFVLWGNIYDVFPFPVDDGEYRLCNLIDYVSESLIRAEGYKIILSFDRVDGFEIIKGETDLIKTLSGLKIIKGEKQVIPFKKAIEYIEKILMNQEHNIALFLKYSSRYTQNPNNLNENEEVPFFAKLFKLSYQIKPHKNINPAFLGSNLNTIFWFADKVNDLPTWLTLDNPRLKIIGIPKPDNEIREIIIRKLVKIFSDYKSMDPLNCKKYINLFVNQTEKMSACDLMAIVQFMQKENFKLYQIADTIRGYKLGIVENRWAKIPPENIHKGEEILKDRIKGQNQAIIKALDIIKRAYIGLSGAQQSNISGKPKGVLFFAGPTGVGKTELAKAITKLIFGSEQNYIRFDMSEFNHEQADQRFIGAPPGYVGYESGGELTNAVKQNPFSLILFDEIEKAHPRILDKFLQILEDGRLTDGRGDTVYFSETLIIFTSNLGVTNTSESGETQQLISPDEADYKKVEEEINKAIKEFFIKEIKRPEILNRLGENIIVFDFIRPEAAKQIFNKMLENIKSKLSEDNKINIEINDEVNKKLLEECTKDLAMGGRGIGNKLEEIFINPLSRALFDNEIKEKESFIISELITLEDNNMWKITGNKKQNL